MQGQGQEIPEQGGHRAETKKQRTRTWKRQFKRQGQIKALTGVFMEFIRGLSWHELGRLFSLHDDDDDDDVANVYVCYPSSERAERPLNFELIWPVNFLCSQYRRERVFEPNLRPSLRCVAQALEQWEQKLRWRMTLKDSELNLWRHLKPKMRTRACEKTFDGNVEMFLQSVKG